MKPAEDGRRHDAARVLDGAMDRSVLVERSMSSQLVIIGGILHQNLAQVRFAEDNHMVDALASDRSDQPFGEAVLPRRAWGDGLVTDAHGPQSAGDECAVDLIPITDQVARRLGPRECFGDLACDPFRGRICRDIDPDKVSAGQPDDDEDIEQIESNGWNNEQVLAAMSGAWLRRKVHHPWDGGPHRFTMYFATLD
jgi:hypothetical protein